MKRILVLFMVSVLMVAAISGCTKEKDTVVVASKPFTEGYILGEMVALVVEEYTDLEVERRNDILGDATFIHEGMLNGDIDMYPEYTSTAWFYLIKQEEVIDDHDELYQKLQAAYNDIGLTWTDLYGLNNTYALTVRQDVVDEYGITNTSDLIAHADELIFGANFDYYEREDGYDALLEAYGFDGFKDEKELNINLRYQALAEGEVDVINGFTTDGLIEKYGLVALEDDLHFFKAYYAGTVIRTETLEAHPELEEALDVLVGLIPDEVMVGLNYKVDAEMMKPEDVAYEFLVEQGVIEPRE